jgi:folate-binding protein YgfZ
LNADAAFLERPTAGLLALTDADRADFLHRMTTNEINKLTAGHAVVTVLTSSTARMLYVFTVLARADELWLLPAPGQTAALARHLRGQIFFMDKVKVSDHSDSYRRLRVIGATATAALTGAGFAVDTLADGAWLEAPAANGEPMVILKQEAYEVPGYEMMVPTAAMPTVIAGLQAAGIAPLTEEAYAAYRIELGRPAVGHELTEAHNPLEAGLQWACADNKGCYTGQEIIARQITYDKVTKTLVGLRSADLLAVDTPLTAEGREVGVVTSSVISQRMGGPIALAVVRRPHHEAGTTLSAGAQTATVAPLPFVRE